MVNEPHTHPVKPTLGSMETSPEAKAIWEQLVNVLRNEEAWEILNTWYNEVYGKGYHDGLEKGASTRIETESEG